MKHFLMPLTIASTIFFSCAKNNPNKSCERIVYFDTLTHNEIWQVSQGDSMSLMPYFEAQGFTYDDRYAVFKSKREGDWKLFSTSIADGTVRKVSDRTVDGSYSIFTTGDEVVFMDGGILYAVNVETSEERILFDANGKVEEKRIGFNSSFTEDGAYTVLTGTAPDKSTSIYRVHLPSGSIEKVFTSPQGLSHPLINPVYPDYITFVPKPDKRDQFDLPREERARGMIVRMDAKEVKPFVTSDKFYRATHETWSKDGERFFYFDKIVKSLRGDGSRGGEVSVVSISKEGNDHTTHYINNKFKLGHGIASYDMRYFVADVQKPLLNPLFLIDLQTGEAEIICWPNQSMPSVVNTQSEHVHPLFSKSGRYIAFTSDRNTPGTPQAFIIPLAKILEK